MPDEQMIELHGGGKIRYSVSKDGKRLSSTGPGFIQLDPADADTDEKRLRGAVASVVAGFLEQLQKDQATIARLQEYQIDANLTISAVDQALTACNADPNTRSTAIREIIDAYYARISDRKESDGDDN